MTSHTRNKKGQKAAATGASQRAAQAGAMPSAAAVAAERARETACETALAALQAADDGSRGDASDSSSDCELRALRPPAAVAPPRRPPAAPALLTPLAAALRAAHPLDVRFLDAYSRLLDERSEPEAQAVTEELMRSVEDVSCGAGGAGGAGGVVLGGWLCAALAWRGPRVPGALPALHRLLRALPPPRLTELARALHAALAPRELLAVSDAVRGRGPLAALLLRAALAKLLRLEPAWEAGAPDAAELRATLAERWGKLGAEEQLAALALAGRVLAGGARGEAGPLLAALGPPPRPRDGHDPDYLKVSAALKTLQNLFKDS